MDSTSIPTDVIGITFLERLIFKLLRFGQVPKHIGVIMDGNRRYARKLSIPTKEGHRAGSLKLFEFLKWCHLLQINIITVYAFSLENFKRKQEEVNDLFDLFLERINLLLEKIHENSDKIYMLKGMKIRFCGDRSQISKELNDKLIKLESFSAGKETEESKSYTSYANDKQRNVFNNDEIEGDGNDKQQREFILNVCLCYTSSNDIYRGISKLQKETRDISTLDDSKLTGKTLSADFADIEDPDMILRTGGNCRLSEFLSFQSSFAVLSFTKSTWPDLSVLDFAWAILNFQLNYPYVQRAARLYHKEHLTLQH